MAEIQLKYTKRDKDRHGNVRWYYVETGKPKVRLNSEGVDIGSPAFFAKYEECLTGRRNKKPRSYSEGTLGHLITSYIKSQHFKSLAIGTQRQREAVLIDLRERLGAMPAVIPAKVLRRGRDQRAETPHAANNRLKFISAMYSWAIDNDLADVNPARDVKRISIKSDGYHTWTIDQIEMYRQHWVIGTLQRLCFELLFELGQRIGDVHALGPQHVRNGQITFKQGKTGRRMVLTVTPMLGEAILAYQSEDLRFLPYKSVKSLGNAFGDWCDAAGLPKECRAHGLRKARATMLANDGATAHQIAAVTGHKTLSEVQRYTLAAEQERLAAEAMQNKSVPPIDEIKSHIVPPRGKPQ